MKFTWERIVKKQRKSEIRFADHIIRYNFAKQFCEWKDVLDIACGIGYGTDILAQVAHKATWVDVDADAVNQSKNSYSRDNLSYIHGDWVTIPLDDNSVDVVVSFETIEHIVDYTHFLEEIKRVLKKDGVLLMSTPNYLGEIVKNEYHVSNFTTNTFLQAVAWVFTLKKTYYQGKHFYAIPGRWILEALVWYRRDIAIREEKPKFEHHVTIALANPK